MALLALLLVLGFAMPSSEAHGTARASLEVVGVEPVGVAGRNFKAGERVRLTVDGRRKTVTAGPRGGFKVVFPAANACNGFTAVARGSEGSRASITFAQFSNVHCLEPRSTQSASTSSVEKPALRLLTREPVAVRGTGFRPSEKVRIIALGSIKRVARQTTADARGTFKASFRLGADRTSNLVIAALGSEGSRATLAVRRRHSGPPPRE
jgi:hypothetical protein